MILRVIVLLLTLLFLSVFSLAVNITVDDSNQDRSKGPVITFTPSNAWILESDSNSTWHESKYDGNGSPPIATLFFNGSAVYVYCILQPLPSISQMSFILDGVLVSRISPSPPGSTEKVVVYSNTSLPMGDHSLVIQNGDSNSPSTMLLDSIIISLEDGSTNTGSSKPRAGIIVGAVLGSLAVIPLVGLGYLLHLRRRQRSDSRPDAETSPNSDQTENQTCAWRSATLATVQRLNPTAIVQRHRLSQPVRTVRSGQSFQIDEPSQRNQAQNNPANHMLETAPPDSPWVVEPTQGLNRVQLWQQQTQAATQDIEMAPPDMSEELSSYYDDNATESQRYRPPTPPPPPRRFIVRNG